MSSQAEPTAGRARGLLGPEARPYLYAVVLGAPVGAVSGVYLWLVGWLRDLVWDGHEPRLAEIMPLALAILVTTTLGGLVVGLIRARYGNDSPHDLDDVLATVDRSLADAGAESAADATDRPPPRSVPWMARAILVGVVSLTAGASLGPEAPLLVLATGFGERIGRILRLSASEAVVLSVSGAVSGLFGGPLGATVLPLEQRGPSGATVRLLGPGIVAGVTGFVTMLLVLPGHGIGYDVPAREGSLLAAAGWGLVAGAVAALAAAVLLLGIEYAKRVADQVHVLPRALAGGLVLGAIGILEPLVLFSGEHEAQTLIDDAAVIGVGGALVILVAKIAATATSIATGFFGGQIFPGAFVGMAGAVVVIALVPAAPVGALMAAGAGAGTTVLLRRPLASALIMLLFFPLTSSIALLVGAGVGAVVVGLLKDQLPEPKPVLGH